MDQTNPRLFPGFKGFSYKIKRKRKKRIDNCSLHGDLRKGDFAG